MKKIYLVVINQRGLHNIKTLEYQKSDTGRYTGWWDKGGNYGEWKNPYPLGWKGFEGHREFATTSLKEAKLVWQGANKMASIIKEIVK